MKVAFARSDEVKATFTQGWGQYPGWGSGWGRWRQPVSASHPAPIGSGTFSEK